MKHISPNCSDKTKEEILNNQATTEQSKSATIKTIYTIADKIDVVTVEQHVHIGGWQCYQQKHKEGLKSWILLYNKSTTYVFG